MDLPDIRSIVSSWNNSTASLAPEPVTNKHDTEYAVSATMLNYFTIWMQCDSGILFLKFVFNVRFQRRTMCVRRVSTGFVNTERGGRKGGGEAT